MEPEKILIELVPVLMETPTEIIEAFITLYDDHLYYHAEYYADIKNEEDEKMPLEKDAYICLTEIVSKEYISGIYLIWKRKAERWKIVISTNGVQEDIYIMFIDPRKAKSFFQKVKAWKYPPKTDSFSKPS